MTYPLEAKSLERSVREEQSSIKIWGIFSFLFILAGFFVFLPYFSQGRSLVSGGDARLQHYPALAYYGSYLRDILKTLWSEHRLVIPAWDIGIGYGGDIISTLHYYCLGEPLTLLSVFFSEEHADLCYTVLVILRLYLAGMGMICFCRHRHIMGYSSVIAGLTYCFSGYAIAPGVFHPFFVIPMIFLPMLLIGADRLFERKSPLLFILSVAFALMSNFYFFYMLVMVVVLYAVLQYFRYFDKFRVKEFVPIFLKFLLCAVVGVLIAMPVFLPNLMSIIQSDRISVAREIPLFYPPEYYLGLLEGTVSEFGEYYVYLSLSAVCMVSLFILLALPKKENRRAMIAVSVLALFLLFPKIGSVFNGFNYVTNRWIWALIFVVCYITAKTLPEAERLTAGQVIKLLVYTFAFYLLCYLPDQVLSEQATIAIWVICVSVILVGLVSGKVISGKVFRGFIVVLTIGTLAVNAYFHAYGEETNWVSLSQPFGELYEQYHRSSVGTVNDLPNEGQGRFDSAKWGVEYNAAILHDIGGTGVYFSTINPGASRFQRQQMLDTTIDQQYSGLDGRSYLDAALSVAYYISDGIDEQPKPYGYDTEISDGIFTSRHTLPLVYAFDSVYTEGESLSVTQKQQTLLQRAMTEDDFGLPNSVPEFSDYAVPYQIVEAHDVTMNEHDFTVEKSGATMTFQLDSIGNSELYCIFEGLDFISEGNLPQASMVISGGGISKKLLYATAYDNYTSGRHDFLINLGYSDEKREELTIQFNTVGTFCFSEFSIVEQPMDDFFQQVDRLADSGISDISVENDVISFAADRERAGIACVAVPFQKGWSATVDGAPAEVIDIQGGLCGIYLDAGQHQVVMKYQNPVTTLSVVLCLIGVISLIGVMYGHHKKMSMDKI